VNVDCKRKRNKVKKVTHSGVRQESRKPTPYHKIDQFNGVAFEPEILTCTVLQLTLY
jgi:hypothetical protein